MGRLSLSLLGFTILFVAGTKVLVNFDPISYFSKTTRWPFFAIIVVLLLLYLWGDRFVHPEHKAEEKDEEP